MIILKTETLTLNLYIVKSNQVQILILCNHRKDYGKKIKLMPKLQYNRLSTDSSCKEMYIDRAESKYNVNETENSK